MLNFLRTLFPLLISTSIVLALTFMAPDYIESTGFHSDAAPWEAFFSTFGLLYAIIVGFLLVTVLNRYGALVDAHEEELNAVEDVRDFLVYLDGDQDVAIANVKRELSGYIHSVSEKEWPAMVKKGWMNSDTSSELYNVMRAVDKIIVTNESDRVSLESIMAKVSDLTSLRTRRISLSNQRLPSRLNLLIGFMSLALISAMILVGGKNVILHMAMVGTISFSVHLLHMIITDLDRPFAGIWKIDKRPLDELKKTFDHNLSE